LKPILKRAIPPALWVRLRTIVLRSVSRYARVKFPSNIYEALYEAHSKLFSDEDVVGGVFDLVGRVELGLLVMEGLHPTDTIVDFGCGTGRLAVHLIPRLRGGHYIGVDVSQSMLDRAERRISKTIPAPPCRVSWIKQTSPVFSLEDRSVDMICAFSVFTHIEHEDTYRYLKDALRVIRWGGRFIFSCLPMSLASARNIFLASAQDDFQGRWSHERNVTTSVDLMEEIARVAGWTPLRWYAGNQENIRLPDTGELLALGQSTCVLEPSPVPPRAVFPAEELGRIVLAWGDGSLTLIPHFTGPLPGGRDRFHLFPSSDPASSRGSLTRPPFATLSVHPEQRTTTISVSRLTSGVYRYSVVARGGGNAGDALTRAGAMVEVLNHEAPQPMVFTLPDGVGPRWTVFDVVVDGHAVTLRPVNTREGDANEAATDAWSPPLPPI